MTLETSPWTRCTMTDITTSGSWLPGTAIVVACDCVDQRRSAVVVRTPGSAAWPNHDEWLVQLEQDTM